MAAFYLDENVPPELADEVRTLGQPPEKKLAAGRARSSSRTR